VIKTTKPCDKLEVEPYNRRDIKVWTIPGLDAYLVMHSGTLDIDTGLFRISDKWDVNALLQRTLYNVSDVRWVPYGRGIILIILMEWLDGCGNVLPTLDIIYFGPDVSFTWEGGNNPPPGTTEKPPEAPPEQQGPSDGGKPSCVDYVSICGWEDHAYYWVGSTATFDPSADGWFNYKPPTVGNFPTKDEAYAKYPGWTASSESAHEQKPGFAMTHGSVTRYRDGWTATLTIWHPCP